MKYPLHLQKLIETLKCLPGVGSKSAERFAFELLDWRHDQLHEFSNLIKHIPEELPACQECGCLVDNRNCLFCNASRQQTGLMCVIASAKDAYAIESTREYKGLYHVLGTLLSPLEGKGPDQLTIGRLQERIQNLSIQELIIALDSTLEGDATALYIKKVVDNSSIKVSRLAFGIPMGSSFDYVDGGTLARALSGRGNF
jgi:recombination protein RecR